MTSKLSKELFFDAKWLNIFKLIIPPATLHLCVLSNCICFLFIYFILFAIRGLPMPSYNPCSFYILMYSSTFFYKYNQTNKEIRKTLS